MKRKKIKYGTLLYESLHLQTTLKTLQTSLTLLKDGLYELRTNVRGFSCCAVDYVMQCVCVCVVTTNRGLQ